MSSPQQEEWASRRQASKRVRKKNTVLTYLVILFAVAFLLLLFSYFSQRRANEAAIDDLEQTSNSAAQSLENIIAERDSLRTQTAELEEAQAALRGQLSEAQRAADALEGELDTANSTIAALDSLNYLRALYNQREYRAAREYLATLEETGDTEAALTEYVSRCPAEQLEVYNPLEAYQDLKNLLSQN